jgi:hypothetical protein
MQLEPRVAPAKAVILHQMLVEVLDGDALIALAVKPLDLLGPIDRNPLARRLAEPPIQQPGFALLLVAPASSAGTFATSTPSSSAASSWFNSADSQR